MMEALLASVEQEVSRELELRRVVAPRWRRLQCADSAKVVSPGYIVRKTQHFGAGRLGWQADAAQQILEARVGAQEVK